MNDDDTLPRSTIRFEAASAGWLGGQQLLVFVDEVEMTSEGAGAGMAPSDLLTPENLLVAGPQPRRLTIARCTCGETGCGSTDVTITRDGDAVHWDWAIEAPMARRATFERHQYDLEVVRIGDAHAGGTRSPG